MLQIIGVTPGTCHRVGGFKAVASIVMACSLECNGGGAPSASRTRTDVSRPSTSPKTVQARDNLAVRAMEGGSPRIGLWPLRSRSHVGRPGSVKDFFHRMALPFGIGLKTERAEHGCPRIQNRHRLFDRMPRLDPGPPGDPGNVRHTGAIGAWLRRAIATCGVARGV